MYYDALLKKAGKVVKEQGPLALAGKALNYLSPIVYSPVLLLKIGSFNNRSTVKEMVDFLFSKAGGIIRPAQVPFEIQSLVEKVKVLEPERIMEIGTNRGGTLFLFSKVSSENAAIISVDLPGGEFGYGYPAWKIPLFKSFASKNQEMHLIRADSHAKETFLQVEKILKGKKLDFLFIDGDHTYDGVKKDFEAYSKLVRKGGLIAFHDIVKHPASTGCEVDIFWKELKRKKGKNASEIVESKRQKYAGIGIIKAA